MSALLFFYLGYLKSREIKVTSTIMSWVCRTWVRLRSLKFQPSSLSNIIFSIPETL